MKHVEVQLSGGPPIVTVSKGAGSLITEILFFLKESHKDVSTRNELVVNEVLRGAEFYKLDSQDSAAGIRILDFLESRNYERVSITPVVDQYGNMTAFLYWYRQE